MGRRGVGWRGEEKKAGSEDAERATHRQADRQTHANTHEHTYTQAKVIQPSLPPDTQTNWR